MPVLTRHAARGPSNQLTEVADGLWTVCCVHKVMGLFDLGTRMWVVRLPDGSLATISFVRPTPAVLAAIDALGTVRYTLATTLGHNSYVEAFRDHFGPDVTFRGPPGMEVKVPDAGWAEPLGEPADDELGAVLDQTLIQVGPHISEVAFVHRPSSTALLSDLMLLPENPSVILRMTNSARPRGLQFNEFFFKASGVPKGDIPDAQRAALKSLRQLFERHRPIERAMFVHDAILEEGTDDALQRALDDAERALS